MAADLYFEAAADAALSAIVSDPTQSKLADQLANVLAILEADPGDRRVRRRQYRAEIVGTALWGIPLRGEGEDWLILWGEHPGEPGAVVIHYIGMDL